MAAIATVVLLAVAAGAGGATADDFEVPGAESQEAIDLFREHSPALAGADSTLVFSVRQGRVTDAGPREAITRALQEVSELEKVAEVGDPFAEGAQVAENGRLVAVDVRYGVEPGEIKRDDGVALEEAVRTAERTGAVEVAMRGNLADVAAESEAPIGELVGVAIAVVRLLVVGIPFIGNMGIGAAIGVAAIVVSALTILPMLLGAFARRLTPKRPEHTQPSPAFARWGWFVTARPWLSIAAGVLVLLVFAFPVTNLRHGQPDDGNQPEDSTQRIAYDRQSEAFGPGSNGPFLIAVATPKDDERTESQLKRLGDALAAAPGVSSVSPPLPSPDGEMATITAVPETSPQDERASELLERLRADVIPAAVEGTPLQAYVGGNTASTQDLSDKVASRLPVFIALVIGLSVLLLVAAFRSLWVPLASAVLNLLSICAAYGVVVAVFQEGIGASLVGVDGGVPIVSIIPVMLFAILFGLSMDYNVFLLSRIREAYGDGEGPRASVVSGVARIGKVVLFAGLIMTAVFLAFVSQPDVIAKMLGLGLGLAILIDVLIVRLVIAPAVVTLLGDRAWWLPGWLDRILPNVSLEGRLDEDGGEDASSGSSESQKAREAVVAAAAR